MITPLSNTTNVRQDVGNRTMHVPSQTPPTPAPKSNKDGLRIPRFRPSVVSFGPVYDNMQQFEHFSQAYHAMILRYIPPLVPISEPPKATRVGVIPSSIKRSAIIPPPTETTTLTLRQEPTTTYRHRTCSSNNISIFSGPHYLPEKYSIKPLKAFRQKYFVPSYTDDDQSRYYIAPDVNHYFQAALQDGSYFESYSEYKPSDPINFRHAYNFDESVNNLEPVYKKPVATSPKQQQYYQPPKLIVPPRRRPKQIPEPQVIPQPTVITNPSPSSSSSSFPSSARKWYKPASVAENDDDDDDDDDDGSDSDDSVFLIDRVKARPRDKGKGRAVDMEIEPSPSPTPSKSSTASSLPYKASPTPAPSSSSKLTTHKNVYNKRRVSHSPVVATKKRKMNNLIPNKRAAIEELRQLGKFIKAWKQKDAEVCCVCFEDVTTQMNPLVYCDNALCEVIVHKNCYKIKTHIGNEDTWYCDRCRPTTHGEPSVHRDVTCVVCPSMTGAFCKLSVPFNGIEWVHMICAKMLTGPGGFTYQPKSHDYRMVIRNHIPLQRFTSTCIYCQDPIFADFGAKLKCQYCPRSFHVTCAEKNGYWCFHKDAVLACSNHAIHTTTKTSPQRLALVFEKWIGKRDAFYLLSYEKTPDSFKKDAWKKTLKHGTDVGDGIDQTYEKFFGRIANIQESDLKAQYSAYVDNLFTSFCKAYTSTTLLSVHGLFLKKNFYHSDVHGYVPDKDAFTMCIDDEAEEDSEETEEEELEMIREPKKRGYVSSSPSTASNSTTNSNPQPPQPLHPSQRILNPMTSPKTSKTKYNKKEINVVIPSDDLVCSICQQHEFPQSAWDKFNFGEDYLQRLEETKHLRKVGHTGTGNSWDPRVFIECSECHVKVHCGCPSPPIKKYPQKFQSFVCIHCDTKGEEILPFQQEDIRRRGTTGINYKV